MAVGGSAGPGATLRLRLPPCDIFVSLGYPSQRSKSPPTAGLTTWWARRADNAVGGATRIGSGPFDRIRYQSTSGDLGLGVACAPPPRVHHLVGGDTCRFCRGTDLPAPRTTKGGGKIQGGRSGGKEVFCRKTFLYSPPAKLHPTSKKQDFLLKLFALVLEFRGLNTRKREPKEPGPVW